MIIQAKWQFYARVEDKTRIALTLFDFAHKKQRPSNTTSSSHNMTTLLGIAIIGKRNEPLYLCDCFKLLASSGDAQANSTQTGQASTTPNDIFGFNAITNPQLQGQSMDLTAQFAVHAALDALEEQVGESHPDGTMPLRKVARNTTTKPRSKKGASGQYLGLLHAPDEHTAVHGYVTATNIKFLALLSGSSPSQSNVTTAVRQLFTTLHSHYIAYWMNPFQPLLRGEHEDPHPVHDKNLVGSALSTTLHSATLNANVRRAVQTFAKAIDGSDS